MSIRKQVLAVAMASACVFAITAAFAEENADEDCDDIMGELKELADTVLQAKTSARTPLAACGAIGQLLGVAKASRAVAEECYDDDKKQAEQVALYEKIGKELEGQLSSGCR